MSLSILQRLAFVVLVLELCWMPQGQAQNVIDSSNAATSASFEELKAQVAAAPADGVSNEAISRLIKAWVGRVGIDCLSVEQLQWCLEQSLPNVKDRKEFSVVWTGLLTPPRDGTYIFSVSPINVNTLVDQNSVRHTIVVSVADKKVIDVGPSKDAESRARRPSARDAREEPLANEWQWKGTPIELQASQSVPIRIEMHYECTEPSAADSPAAILSWEGPGIGRQVVSSDVFTSEDGLGKGLRAEYSLHDGEGPPRTVIQSSPNIDFAWTTPADVAPANPALVVHLTNRLWQLATTPEFLGTCAAGTCVHPYFRSSRGTEFLTSAQRSEFLRLLVDNQQLLSRVDDRQLLQLYRSLRIGAEEDAIDLLGTWMQLNSDITPKITADFFRENRQVYAELAIHLARQHQGAYRLLQDRYLEMPDGRCALPVAYTVCYCHLLQQSAFQSTPAADVSSPQVEPLSEWMATLDAKAASESDSSNVRISWLIAKAQATEVDSAFFGSTTQIREDYLGGMGWLAEARVLADQSVDIARVYREEVSRLAVLNRRARLNSLLDEATSVLSAEEVSAWRGASETIGRRFEERKRADAIVSRAAYEKTIRQRRRQAVERNDEESVRQFDQVLIDIAQ